MMRSIVGSSLNLRFMVVAIAVIAMVAGVLQLPRMPVDVLPEFSPPYVEIQTEALGLSAQEVEQLITLGLEQDLLNGVPWLETIHSKSVPGLSSIVLVFEPGTDITRARQMVGERLAQAFALPHVSKPPSMIQPLSSMSRFMIVGLSSKNLSLIQMSVLARWTIGPRLMGVPGVANVAIWGNRDRQLQVQVDPARLKENGVTLLQVLETTGNALWVSSLSFLEASTPGTGGFIDTPQQRLGVWHVSPITSPKDLASVPVEEAPSLRLGDVATVIEDHQPLIGDAIINDDPNILLVIEKFPGANTLEVTQGVEAALTSMQPGLGGINIDTSIFRPANYIELAVKNLSMTILIGGLLMIMILSAFFYNWRTTLISLVTIILSLIAAVYILYLRGTTMNVMVLTGLLMALGVVVDDAIIDVEKIILSLRHSREAGDNKSIFSIILETSLEVRRAIFYAMVILLLAAMPIFFIEGVVGAFLQPLAISYAIAIAASMLIALFVTPALCLILLGNASSEYHDSPLVGRRLPAYERTLGRIIQRPLSIIVSVAIIIGVCLVILPRFNQSLLPAFKEGDLVIHLNSAPGTSQPEMSRIVARMTSELRAIPGVSNVGAHLGRAVFGDQVVNVNSSEMWVSINPANDYDRTVSAITEVVNGYPGLSPEVETYLQDRTIGLVTKPNNSVVVRIYGDTTEVLRSATGEVEKSLTGIKGIADLRATFPVEEPTLEINVSLAKAQQYGLKPGDVRRTAAILLSGIQVGNLFEEQKVFDVVVRGTPETRNSLSSVLNLLIDTPSGTQVRLGDVADVRIVAVPNVIEHEAVKRYIDITAKVQGRNLDAVATDIKSRLRKVQFPLEYHAEVLNQFAERQASQMRLFAMVVTAMLGIFLLLQAVYKSWRLAFATFLALPVALAGGVIAAFATGGILSIGSLIGFLGVFGITVRNMIVLINHYQNLEQFDRHAFGFELALRGARERWIPTLMTALAIGMMLIPSLFFGDTAGLEIVRPMVVVTLGGLVTSTIFSLFVVPTLYLRFGANREPELGLLSITTPDNQVIAAD